MHLKITIICIFSIAIISFIGVTESTFILPKNFPEPVYDFSKNPLSKNKILLGRVLFYDPILSRNNTISCASCHSQFTAFTHVDHALSHGIEDKIGIRNAPSLVNLAWKKLLMHDGAVNHLDMQSLAPISNPVEMDEDISHIVSKLQRSRLYQKLYLNAFGDTIITGANTLKALSQFMLTLVSSNSKYDSVCRKEAEFTKQENNGYLLFKKNCASCHKEPLFTNDEFRNNGLAVDTSLKDYGRYKVTNNISDSLLFKVPTLRNIEFSYPYMHDGRFKKLWQVLQHYTEGIEKNKTLSKELNTPLELSSNDKVDIIVFMLTLTDKTFLFNPEYFYPKEIFFGNAKE